MCHHSGSGCSAKKAAAKAKKEPTQAWGTVHENVTQATTPEAPMSLLLRSPKKKSEQYESGFVSKTGMTSNEARRLLYAKVHRHAARGDIGNSIIMAHAASRGAGDGVHNRLKPPSGWV